MEEGKSVRGSDEGKGDDGEGRAERKSHVSTEDSADVRKCQLKETEGGVSGGAGRVEVTAGGSGEEATATANTESDGSSSRSQVEAGSAKLEKIATDFGERISPEGSDVNSDAITQRFRSGKIPELVRVDNDSISSYMYKDCIETCLPLN